jgi:NAD(P)H-dependent FMN reductase
MTQRPRVLALAGSLREKSFNKALVRIAARGAEAAGAEVTVLDMRDYRLPVFDGDAEAREGAPDAVRALKAQFFAHDGLLIASPEYNGSLTAALKNALDWLSRREEGEAPLAAFDGKVAGLLAASPGGLGGLRGLAHLRQILSGIRVLVIPEQYALANAQEALDVEDGLREPQQEAAVQAIGARVSDLARRLKT